MGEARRRRLAGEMPTTPKPPKRKRVRKTIPESFEYYPMMFTHMAMMHGLLKRRNQMNQEVKE